MGRRGGCLRQTEPWAWGGRLADGHLPQTGSLIKKVRRFEEPVSSCVWARDSASFVLGTLDKKYSLCSFNVHDDGFFDWKNKHRVQDLCGSPDGRWLVAVDDKSSMHVYSGLTRELEYHLDMGVRLTSVSISQDSRHLLVNRKDGEAQLVDLTTRNSVQKFLGHKGGIFLIRSSFGGANESFVTSGSDDGNILIWHKNTGVAVERLHGHVPRCNAVSWSPSDPRMLASGGDDGRVKVYAFSALNQWPNGIEADDDEQVDEQVEDGRTASSASQAV